MEERQKYEEWLDDLEAKKDSTPPKVFERVRQDYLTRLQEVMEKLSEHTSLLEEHGRTLAAKLRELEMAEESITEQQAEAALRKQVGEITPAEWESSSKKAQKELNKIRENQEEISEELERIRDLLGDEEEEEEEEVQVKPAKKGKDFNELEFLTKVVGSNAPTPDSVPARPRTTPRGSPVTRSSGPSPKTATPTSTPVAPAAPQSPPVAPPPSAAPITSVSAPTPAPATAAASTTGPSPEAARGPTEAPSPSQPRKSMMAEQPKTLKCGECGTMNYPSEWYCERCGAELTIV